MSEKRYYWLKLFDDFFTSKRIKRLRNLAGGDTYTIIYLKMQLKALKDAGYLYFDGIMDDFAEELALDIDEKVEDVKITIQYLLSVGLLETNNEEVYKLTFMDRLIGSESASTQRSRECRARQREQKVLQCNDDATLPQQPCNVEIDIEKEIDIDKDIDIYKKENVKEKKKTASIDVYKALDDAGFTDKVNESVRDWLTYKKERKDKYTETGLKKLFSQIKKQISIYGEDAVCDVIDLSISNQWQGILWKRLEENKPRESAYMQAIKDRVNVVDSWV